MSITETSTESTGQYEHIVLVAAKPALLTGEQQRERVRAVLEEGGEQADLPVASVEFGDDRAHIYVENPERHASDQVLNLLKVRSETVYRYRHDYDNGHLRWSRGFHVATVGEGDLP